MAEAEEFIEAGEDEIGDVKSGRIKFSDVHVRQNGDVSSRCE